MYDVRPFNPLYAPNSGIAAGGLLTSLTLTGATTATSGTLSGNPGTANQIQIANTTTAWAYVNFGRNTTEIPAATVAASYPVAPGGVVVVTVNSEVGAASVILGSGGGAATAVIFTRGAGS
jgi:hypothetical protein